MAADTRSIDAVALRAAEKHADRLLTVDEVKSLRAEDRELVRGVVTDYVAASRAGLSSRHSLEVATGLCSVSALPEPVASAHSLEDFLGLLRDYSDRVPGVVSGVYESLRSSGTPPPPLSLAGRRYRRFVPEKPLLVGVDSLLHEVVQSVRQLFFYDVLSGNNPLLDAMYPSVLFTGPPGTGKSSLCRYAIAEGQEWSVRQGLPFRYETFSSNDYSKWQGESAQRLHNKYSRVSDDRGVGVLVLDDVDLVIQSRDDPSAYHGGLQVTGMLMQDLSGIGAPGRGNVLVLGTTNRAETLDIALRDRFARVLDVPGFRHLDEYASFMQQRLSWLPGSLQEEVAVYAHRQSWQPRTLDALVKHLGRASRGDINDSVLLSAERRDEYVADRSLRSVDDALRSFSDVYCCS